MKYIDEFRNRQYIRSLLKNITEVLSERTVRIMEVCGTHTHNFYRFGLNKLLPDNLNLIAGPGCPICVSEYTYIDNAIKISRDAQTIVLTFSDMLNVPGTQSSLAEEKSRGADIRVMYSAWDSLQVAQQNPDKRIVVLAVGFETTAPTFALTILSAKQKQYNNIYFYAALKTIPAAMKMIATSPEVGIEAFLCPGHVSAIIGSRPYEFIAKRYRLGCCIAGFEPFDILQGIYILLCQIVNNKPNVANQYIRVVKRSGNPQAQSVIGTIFVSTDAFWRGFGDRSGNRKVRLCFICPAWLGSRIQYA